ncbi:unnamed protein product [Euphydryas editha]|uniref:FLYWCH-type domain-containing protein n=1 Tax=Euphydryas editha TaxID=104508 RepID=A0AAU9TIG6_EUPED|nr:unnamed protein product [Euphydryas editha]
MRKEKRLCSFRNSWICEFPWIEPLEEKDKVYWKIQYWPTSRGNIPVYQNYTFSFRDKKHLHCSRKFRGKCNAKLVVDLDGHIKYEILPTIKGKQNIILVEGYSFSIQGGNPNTFYCSSKSKLGCKARLGFKNHVITKYYLFHNHPPPHLERAFDGYNYEILPMLGNKSVVLFRNYTYSFHVKGGRTLQCSRKLSMQCGAYLKMDKNKKISYAYTCHTHAPATYRKTANGLKIFPGLNYEFIRVAQAKKPLILLQNYTFARTTSDNRYWNCSKKCGLKKCPARLKFDSHGNLVFIKLDHNHEPPTFYKQKDGQYVKIK